MAADREDYEQAIRDHYQAWQEVEQGDMTAYKRAWRTHLASRPAMPREMYSQERGVRRAANRKGYRLRKWRLEAWSTLRAWTNPYTLKGTGSTRMYTLDQAEEYLRTCAPKQPKQPKSTTAPAWAQGLVDEVAHRYPHVGREKPTLIWKLTRFNSKDNRLDIGGNYAARANHISIYPESTGYRGTLLHELAHWVVQTHDDHARRSSRYAEDSCHGELFYGVCFELYKTFLAPQELQQAVREELDYQLAAAPVARQLGLINDLTYMYAVASHATPVVKSTSLFEDDLQKRRAACNN